MNFFVFPLRMLRRDARASELRLLVSALLIAVAALSAVGFFTDRVQQALDQQANQLLGADLLLVADHPLRQATRAAAQKYGLSSAETRSFPSMVILEKNAVVNTQLAEIKAVSEDYPLRGALRIKTQAVGSDQATEQVPAPGTIWLDERLATALHSQIGDQLMLGQSRLHVAAILTQEPDRGFSFFSASPRLLMNLSDLKATELITPGARVTHRFLLAGEKPALEQFRRAIENTLQRGERLEDTENARPEIRRALQRAQQFLGLAALLTVILAAVAVALAAQRYTQRHLDACAVMRCLGATQHFLLRTYAVQFVVLGIVATVIGCALGYLAHLVLYTWLANLLPKGLPQPSYIPALQGAACGVLLLFGFALPPILQLKNVSTLRVLRREFVAQDSTLLRLLSRYALGLIALLALMFWVAGEKSLGAYVAGGFSAAMILFALLARLAIRALAHWRGIGQNTQGKLASAGIGWRYGLASLERRAGTSVLQIVALALGFMALLLLTVTRNDLLDAWQRATPAQAANHFVINIQPEQLGAIKQRFAAQSLSAEFSPMIRARLTQRNGVDIGPDSYSDERAKRLVDREFNLSYRSDLPAGNSLSAGTWFSAQDLAPEANTNPHTGNPRGASSIEEGLAKTLGLKIGDHLTFSIGGELVEMDLQSLRKLNWDSMRVNFFVLTAPALLDAYPASWITSFYLSPAQNDFTSQLVQEFPNLTVIDVAAILQQLQSIMKQVAQAVQFIFLFTLASGIIVLYAALAAAAHERRYELGVMRALGARREQLRRALLVELAAIGGISGLIAALGALSVGQLLAQKAFQFEVSINYALPLWTTLSGALLVMCAGWFAAAKLLDTPPLAVLRAA